MSFSTPDFRHLCDNSQNLHHEPRGCMSPLMAGPKTVLCVDDTPYVLQMLDMFLTAVGYRSIPASNGREALELATNFSLDAVILDYEMPDLNGLEVAQILKREHP